MFVFLVCHKSGLVKVVHPLNVYQNTKFNGPALTGAVLYSSQKFECPPYWNGCNYGIKNDGIEVTANGMTLLLNFVKIYQLVQTCLG
jgi:hypothetical protein